MMPILTSGFERAALWCLCLLQAGGVVELDRPQRWM